MQSYQRSKISEFVQSFRSGGQNSRPDCRHCRRSARQLSDLELSFLDLLRQFDAADRDGRRVESFQPQHRYNPLLDPPMILLDDSGFNQPLGFAQSCGVDENYILLFGCGVEEVASHREDPIIAP